MLIEFAYCKAEPLREPFHLPRRNMSCIILMEAAQPFVPLFSSAAINIILHSLINANPLGPPDTKDKRQRTSAKRRCNKEPSTAVKNAPTERNGSSQNSQSRTGGYWSIVIILLDIQDIQKVAHLRLQCLGSLIKIAFMCGPRKRT